MRVYLPCRVGIATNFVGEYDGFSDACPHAASHTRQQQASEKRQGTKSREGERLRCDGLYAGLTGMPTLIVSDGVSRAEAEGGLRE